MAYSTCFEEAKDSIMDREYHQNELPEKLTKFFQARLGLRVFRRRAVLVKSNGDWSLLCCTIEGFPATANLPIAVQSLHYKQATLHEEWLTGAECQNFAVNIQAGHATFGNLKLQREPSAHWIAEPVSVDNDFMPHAGCVVSVNWGNQGTPAHVRTLVDPYLPYYPDTEEAAKHWLPLSSYHGHSDGRNNQVMFLLPEDRAFVSGSSYGDDERLTLTLAGSEVRSMPLVIKCAYWQQHRISHAESPVSNGSASFAVPADADRLEYCLLDSEGNIYDFHREDKYSRLRNERSVLDVGKLSLERKIRRDANDGEGPHVEFKPFVDPRGPLVSHGNKTKLREVITTVAAFANISGGSIYLGIDDDCMLTGIALQLSEWAKGEANESNLAQYVGALRTCLKDNIVGEVAFKIEHVVVDGAPIIAIEVPEADTKPISVRQDSYLYARKMASNRKVPPEEWQSVIGRNHGSPFSNWNVIQA
jgi:hypothetical protein